MFLGIDIGSSSTKVALINAENYILATSVTNLGTGTALIDDLVADCLQRGGVARDDVDYSVVTGYGRFVFKDADEQVTEITCHAKGAHFLFPLARTIIDIGGQDAKVIQINEQGNVLNFVMNEKCAAGTGRFLEVMARILNCKISDLSILAEDATEKIEISSTCTVFAESEVISHLASGKNRGDVALGAHQSVAKRIAGLASRIGIDLPVFMTGGVALNKNLVKALEKEIGAEIVVSDYAQVVGAIGAAVIAKEKYMKEERM